MTSTGRYEFYSLFLEGNSHCNSNDKILARFIFLKSIKIRFLVLIIWYALKNPRFLSLLPFPPKMCALDLGSSQSPEDTWHFFCLLAPAGLVNLLTFIVRSSTVLGKLLVALLCSLFNPSALNWALLQSSGHHCCLKSCLLHWEKGHQSGNFCYLNRISFFSFAMTLSSAPQELPLLYPLFQFLSSSFLLWATPC